MRRWGSIRRLPSSWNVRWYSGRLRFSRSFRTREQAERFLEEQRAIALAQRKRFRYRDLAPLLERQWKSRGLRSQRRHTPRTLQTYRCSLERVLVYWGKRDPSRTTRQLVAGWIAELEERGYSTSTISGRVNTLSQLHQIAVLHGLLQRVPCDLPRPRAILRSRPRVCSEADYGAFLAFAGAAGDRRAEAIFRLAGEAGLRVAEIGRLEVQDIDLVAGDHDFGMIHVATRDEVERTKSGRGRNVPILTRRLRDVLEELVGRNGGGALFGLTASGVTHAASRISVAARGRPARLHELRRRFASQLAEQGVSAPKIQLWLGHSSLLTTQRYIRLEDRPSLPVRLEST